MKTVFVFLMFWSFLPSFAQTDQLARNYFDRGDFEKALVIYKQLYEKEPYNQAHFMGLVESYQQLRKFGQAEDLLRDRLNTTANAPHYLIELGHNYELQEKKDEAVKLYDEALRSVESRPNFAFPIARTFEKYSLLDYAVAAYELGMSKNPDAEFGIQLARLYGEQGEIDKMLSYYIDVVTQNETLLPAVSRIYGQFITEDPENEANRLFRQQLLKRMQHVQSIILKEMLSWLYIQQQDFDKAFLQLKAIYRRSGGDLGPLMRLSLSALDHNQIPTAIEILEYIIAESPSQVVQLQAHQLRLNAMQKITPEEDFGKIQKIYEELVSQYSSVGRPLLSLKIDQANFLAFRQGNTDDAKRILESSLESELGSFDEAGLKMALADILVLEEKFNRALIYYSQVQTLVENDQIAQTAAYKVARTSYYKGDFKWALMQLDVLKSATSQLVANDAMELSLLITENKSEDSTQAALRAFARADLLAFQKKNRAAIGQLDSLLVTFKGAAIEDEALLRQALLLKEEGDFDNAEANLLRLITNYGSGILGDNAHYQLAELYFTKGNLEKAKTYYEKIIFEYPDSIYFVDARKKFRALRGDALE